MKVNIVELQKLLKFKFNGNQTAFSRALNIDRTHLNKVLKSNGRGAGNKICGALIKYCIENDIDCQKFIFFDNNVKKEE